MTFFEPRNFLHESVITELFAMISSHDDDGVVPLIEITKGLPKSAHLFINGRDHAKVLSSQVTHL